MLLRRITDEKDILKITKVEKMFREILRRISVKNKYARMH